MSTEESNNDLVIGTGEQWLGHPRALFVLFFSEMWERFCYYGMRVLLILFLTKSLMHGDHGASLIYGAYCALVYAAPVLGGRMADRYLGYRYAIILGAILMSIGEFLILGGTDQFLLIGMGAIIIGNGYFKANISTIVGKLYKDGDPRRDSGFTIFYIGINIGALLATTVVAYVGETYGFKYGFGLAGLGMLMGSFIFWNGRKKYEGTPGLEIREAGKKKAIGPLNMVQAITIGSICLIPLCYILINQNEILKYLFLGLFIIVAYQLISAGAKAGKEWKDRMIALVIFMIINIIFWACFEQAGTSLTLFADRNVDREILGWIMPASMTQFFNPAFIIIFGSLFSIMWIKLSKIGKNPSIPIKFALGIFQLGLGFLVTMVGFQLQAEFMVPLLTLVFLYLLHTTGELFISPIGLSMVTKLAPKNIAGTAMGGWFLSFAIANFLGGQIAALTGAEGGGDEAEENNTELSMDTTVKEGLNDATQFETWTALNNQPKNINVEKYVNLRDWVEFRTAYDNNGDYNEWANSRSLNTPFKSTDEWLDTLEWNKLNRQLIELDSLDKINDSSIGFDAWMYFRDGFQVESDIEQTHDSEETNLIVDNNNTETVTNDTLTDINEDTSIVIANDSLEQVAEDSSVVNSSETSEVLAEGSNSQDNESNSIQDAFTKHKSVILEKGLNKYVDIFSIIGFVLIGFSLLIALLSRPLNKLMHGVE